MVSLAIGFTSQRAAYLMTMIMEAIAECDDQQVVG
jgi:hypothetical protein